MIIPSKIDEAIEALQRGFIWADSSQGMRYWMGVAENLQEIAKTGREMGNDVLMGEKNDTEMER